jgi:hypothetical protein
MGVTTALILTFPPGEKGQRLHASLYAVVRRANPVEGARWFRGSMREFFGEFSPGLAGRGGKYLKLKHLLIQARSLIGHGEKKSN